jgi:hypothetical protein
VTVVLPPQAFGAAGAAGVVVNTPLQPPLAVVEASQVAKAVLMAACVWHAASVWSGAQVKMTGGAGVTVKVFVQVCGTAQLVVYVQVTVVLPPQADGATGAAGVVVSTPLQPPLAVVEASHVAKAVLMAACV